MLARSVDDDLPRACRARAARGGLADQLGRAAGHRVSFEIDALTLVGNTGTYLDSPFHFHADRADLARLPLQRLVDVPIVVVRAYGNQLTAPSHPPSPSGCRASYGGGVHRGRPDAVDGGRAED
jgi:hypothetical protein